jgi:hypothetical protein
LLLLTAAALLLRLPAAALAAFAARVVRGRGILRGRGLGRGIGARAAARLALAGTAFGDGVAAVFTVFVFGHGQTSLGAVAVKLEGRKWV